MPFGEMPCCWQRGRSFLYGRSVASQMVEFPGSCRKAMTVVGVTVGYVWLTASAWSSHSALTAPHSASHAPHMCLPAPPSALTVPHRPSHALTCPHRSHRSHSHPTGVSQVSHRFLKEPHRHLTGVRPPSSPKTANFPPKCVDSLPPPDAPPAPPRISPAISED